MEKKIWLRVIREELGLLDQLATGMIDDEHLAKEEVELAIARAKIVAKEFEMLLGQVSIVSVQDKVEAPVARKTVEETIIQEDIPLVIEIAEYPLSLEEEEIAELPNPPVPPSPSPLVSQSPSLPVSQSPSPQVSPSPSPDLPLQSDYLQSKSPYFRHEREEHALNLEVKKEDLSIFKPTPIKSLKEGLILNDRYLFQRELFNNDKSKLDETVAALDRLDNIQEAVDYLKSNFKWSKSEASEKFVQLVKRRFS